MKSCLPLIGLLLASCSLFRPSISPEEIVPQRASQIALEAATDTLSGDTNHPQVGSIPSVTASVPAGLTPRQQRRFLRVASRAQARVLAAQQPTTPLISVSKVKDKSDNRGSQGGSYAPRAKSPVAAGGSTATQTEVSSTSWLWWVLVGGIAWLVWRARASR